LRFVVRLLILLWVLRVRVRVHFLILLEHLLHLLGQLLILQLLILQLLHLQLLHLQLLILQLLILRILILLLGLSLRLKKLGLV